MSRKRVEIGSEFWFEHDLPQTVSDRDGVYVLSGRTAIDLIIQDILKTRKVRNVYMPAWCCDSMIAPFTNRNINVVFYDVCHTDDVKVIGYNRLKVKDVAAENVDILYITNYFGNTKYYF